MSFATSCTLACESAAAAEAPNASRHKLAATNRTTRFPFALQGMIAPKPVHETGNPLGQCCFRCKSEVPAGLGNIRIRLAHVAGRAFRLLDDGLFVGGRF